MMADLQIIYGYAKDSIVFEFATHIAAMMGSYAIIQE